MLSACGRHTDYALQKRGKTVDEHQDLYQAEIIQQMVNRIYFKNRNDDGVVLSSKYSPFPQVALALILTAVCVSSPLLIPSSAHPLL